MAVPGFISPSGINDIDGLINYLTELVNELQNILSMLDHQNVNRFNYIPLLSGASLGNATPKPGWVRAVQSSGITHLQYYSTAWITLMKFSTAYQTNSAGLHDHSITVPAHHHTVMVNSSSVDTSTDGAATITTASTGAHVHVLITT